MICHGALLTYGRVRLAFTIEGRDKRRHVSAVDAREPQDPTTDTHDAAAAPECQRLFARERPPEPAAETAETAPPKPKRRGGKAATGEKQD